MIPLWEDQIHAPVFQKQCEYFYSDDVSRDNKSGVWEYALQCASDYNMKLIDYTCMPKSGVIYVGLCHILEDIYDKIPRDGSYIIVHRTNDRPYTSEMHRRKPDSIKHIYSVDSQVYAPDVSAIPFGNASINGNDNLVGQIAVEPKREVDKSIFVCYNTNAATVHRNASIMAMMDKPYAFVYKLDYPHIQMAGDEFYRNVHGHKYTMALAGCGADASRQWAAIQLGSIPIVTDCPEMRHFADLPLIYCPKNFADLTIEWLEAQDMTGKSTDRMRASYWTKHIQDKRKEHSI